MTFLEVALTFLLQVLGWEETATGKAEQNPTIENGVTEDRKGVASFLNSHP